MDSKQSSNELTLFNFKGSNVRVVIDKDNKPWFVGQDVLDVLGIARSGHTYDTMRDTDTRGWNIPTSSGVRTMICLNESGVYKMIFKSRKPEAEAFQDWLAHDVLPSINRLGVYMTPKIIDELTNNPDLLLSLVTKLKDEKARRIQAEDKVEELSTKCIELQNECGLSKEYATVKMVQSKTGQSYDWKFLKDYCNAKELTIKKVYDTNYGSVNAYPKESWMKVYDINLGEFAL